MKAIVQMDGGKLKVALSDGCVTRRRKKGEKKQGNGMEAQGKKGVVQV